MARFDSHRLVASVALFVLAAALAPIPRPARAGPWTFGLGGGLASGYRYRVTSSVLGDFSTSFPQSWMGIAAANRGLNDHVSLRAETGYLPYERTVSFVSAFVPQPSGPGAREMRARFVPIGIGLRLEVGRPPARPRLYADVVPLAVWSKYDTEFSYVYSGGSLSLPSIDLSRGATESLWRPGIDLVLGFRAPMARGFGYEAGVRYIAATDPDVASIKRLFAEPNLTGLRQFAMTVGVTFTR